MDAVEQEIQEEFVSVMIKRFKHVYSKVHQQSLRQNQSNEKGELDLLNLTHNVQSGFTSDLIRAGPTYLQI